MLRQCFCIRIAQACDSGKKSLHCVCVCACVCLGPLLFCIFVDNPLEKKVLIRTPLYQNISLQIFEKVPWNPNKISLTKCSSVMLMMGVCAWLAGSFHWLITSLIDIIHCLSTDQMNFTRKFFLQPVSRCCQHHTRKPSVYKTSNTVGCKVKQRNFDD